jgi:hypothetical protein
VAAVLLVVLSKSVWVTVLGNAQALFPYDQPALFSMPLAFLITFIVSKLDNSAEAQAERAAFEDQYVRAQTGFGAAEASATDPAAPLRAKTPLGLAGGGFVFLAPGAAVRRRCRGGRRSWPCGRSAAGMRMACRCWRHVAVGEGVEDGRCSARDCLRRPR